MFDHNQDVAGRIMAHAFNDELEKISGIKDTLKRVGVRAHDKIDDVVSRKLGRPSRGEIEANYNVSKLVIRRQKEKRRALEKQLQKQLQRDS